MQITRCIKRAPDVIFIQKGVLYGIRFYLDIFSDPAQFTIITYYAIIIFLLPQSFSEPRSIVLFLIFTKRF
ncbi:hypothetical protein ES708_12966 [subsurface metagenome]